MLKIKKLNVQDYEQVIEAIDEEVGLHSFIAVHNTSLGPAMGGTRIFNYTTPEAALEDALRLSKAMTYKSAMAENGLGGGKAVIIGDAKKIKTPELLKAYGKAVDSLKGIYIAAEDVGTTTDDMSIISTVTSYVGALPTDKSSGDPSRFTAWGVSRGMRAVAQKLWGNDCLRKKVVAIQGLGSVGSKLANILFWEGAYLIICDKDPEVVHEHACLYGAQVVDPEEFAGLQCDILAPCAMGGVINQETLPKLRCKAVAGAANNQLLTPDMGQALMDKHILYAPDYVINAGGIINASVEYESEGYDPKFARDRVNHIYDTLLEIFEKSAARKKPTNLVADEMAEDRLNRGISKRKKPILFASRMGVC